MGSSGSGGVEDCSVGSIVWVRRRNGSWWPGKILRPDELSATHLMSPRSGTPVKLLGREDASVDWYNLEKSKRVKAFRCGEFDECIERAESSQGMPAKKREKYARREDAILHALELEKQLLEKDQGEVGIASDSKSSKLSDSVDKELITSSESLPYRNGKLGNAKPDQLSTSLDSFLKDEKGSSLYAQIPKEGNQLGLEDNNSETIPQMRGLQDFELGTAPLKRKFSTVTSNGSQRPAADDHAHAPSYGGVSMEGTSHANSNVDIRKKSNGGLTEDILVKRRDKRRPLDQVLQTSAELPASPLLQADSRTVSLSMSGVDQIGDICRAKRSRCMYLPAESRDCLGNSESAPKQMEVSPPYMTEDNCQLPDSLMEENTSGFTEDEESESSETEDLETDSDGETNALSDADVHLEAEALVGSEVQGKHGTMDDEELDELALSDDLSHLHPHYPVSANAGVSKWKMKGKRNVRYLTKKLGGVADVKGSTGFVDGTYMEEKGINFSRRPLEHTLNFNQRSDAFSNDLPESGLIENRRHTLISKAASKHRNRNGFDIIDWEDLAWEETSCRGYLDADEYLDPVFVGRHRLGGRTATTLIDVDLKVQASYKKEHVPIVSLMSKVDGKAIIGHPIQIEALKEGSSEIFLSENDFGNKAQHNEGDTTLPPVWRTGRRTANSRVPRPHPSSALENDEAADHLPLLGHERRPPLKKRNGWGFTQKGSLMKNGPHIPRPQTDGKFLRKLPKKASLSSSQKTRTLSSIGMEQKVRDPKHYSDGYSFDGIIKPVSGPTTVACIPIKLVFSRLYEAVGRQPSRPPS